MRSRCPGAGCRKPEKSLDEPQRLLLDGTKSMASFDLRVYQVFFSAPSVPYFMHSIAFCGWQPHPSPPFSGAHSTLSWLDPPSWMGLNI